MDQSKIDNINYPDKILWGIKPDKPNFSEYDVYGWDVETIHGKVCSLQISGLNHEYYYDDNRLQDTKKTLNIFLNMAKDGKPTIFFAHNMNFDLGTLLPNLCLGPSEGMIQVKNRSVDYTIYYPEPVYMILKSKNKKLVFMDTLPWFCVALKYTATAPKDDIIKEQLKESMTRYEWKRISQKRINDEKKKYLNLHTLPKLKHPEYLGERGPKNKQELKHFKEYALRDAVIAEILGKKILDFHRDFNVSLNYSVRPSTTAAKIFKKDFLKIKIPFPIEAVSDIALKSYWGGRTEAFACGTFGTDDKPVTMYDFSSAYPYAMTQIKIPIENKWRITTEYEGPDAFYCVSGHIPKMKISPLPYRTKDKRLIFPCGRFKDVFLTGFETAQVMKYADRFKVRYGYIYEGKSSDCLKNYVKEFYTKKTYENNKVMRLFWKLLLNSLYGKFVQLVEQKDKDMSNVLEIDLDKGRLLTSDTFRAGGLFNSPIGSWITGHARARLHKFMMMAPKDVLYCDTDSIMIRNDAVLPTGNKLGDLVEEKEGIGVIIREKLYLICSASGEILKTGKHGFWGNDSDLKKMIDGKDNSYQVTRMMKLREAKIQNKQAFDFVTQPRKITLRSSNKRIPTGITNFTNPGIETEAIVL